MLSALFLSGGNFKFQYLLLSKWASIPWMVALSRVINVIQFQLNGFGWAYYDGSGKLNHHSAKFGCGLLSCLRRGMVRRWRVPTIRIQGYAHQCYLNAPKTSLIQHLLTKLVRQVNKVHQASPGDAWLRPHKSLFCTELITQLIITVQAVNCYKSVLYIPISYSPCF